MHSHEWLLVMHCKLEITSGGNDFGDFCAMLLGKGGGRGGKKVEPIEPTMAMSLVLFQTSYN